ncbi:response regulator transcription factor [Dyadobacter tibetensis]|uniref:response regulator transcription factor n=1 Tax=Dyadobacter tibetensis TaxID=1211851 RepID=UPI0004722F00|nr:response regulator transcription factor [Dyadobacter tibetensis]
MAIRLLIVDDHAVVRQGIITLLEDESDLEIVGEAADGDEVEDALQQLRPDVMLLDLTMPHMSGIDVLQKIMPGYPKVKVLIFSMHNQADYILAAVHNGAAGYLQKDTSRAEILKAVRSVAAGELYFPPNVSSIIIQTLVQPSSNRTALDSPPISDHRNVWGIITARERQILECLVEGLSSKEIAARFDISVNTVANQRASIMKKAEVKNTAELIILALREKP